MDKERSFLRESQLEDGLFLGIDLGTSCLKVALYDEQGQAIATARHDVQMLSPRPGIYEQSPQTWWRNLCSLLNDLFSKIPTASQAIRVIGVCGQSHGPTPFSKSGMPISNCMTWLDQRGSQEVEWILDHVGNDVLLAEGNPPADTCYTAAKLLWLKHHKPDLYENTYKFLLPKDVLTFKLTGEFATDVTDASVTDLFCSQTSDWSRVILDSLGIPASKLPDVHQSHHIIGAVCQQAAVQTGLRKGTPVIAGAADWACLYYGAGGIKPGMSIDLTGTVGGLLITTREDLGLPSTMSVIPGLKHAFGCCLESSSVVYEWYRGILGNQGRPDANKVSLAELDSWAAEVPAGSDGVMVVPRFAGARLPEKSNSKGTVLGLTLSTTTSQLARAILEGVAYEIRRGVERLRAQGFPCEKIRAIGGGARSGLWRQIKADVTRAEYEIINVEEAGAFGVAMIGGYALGAYPTLESPIERFVQVKTTASPVAENVTIYDRYFEAYENVVDAMAASGIYEILEDNQM